VDILCGTPGVIDLEPPKDTDAHDVLVKEVEDPEDDD
jgi:hypothetical protein